VTDPVFAFPGKIVRATLLKRYKRFLADCRLDDGTLVTAHCPNSGTMSTCWEEGCEAALTDHGETDRKLRYTLEMTKIGRGWVGVNTMWPNKATAVALEAGVVPGIDAFETLRREVAYGKNSRIDILLEGKKVRTWVEVKNTTLKDGAVVRFPDAVTERGLKHLHELESMVKVGDRAVLVFFVNRADVEIMSSAPAIDPEYAKALVKARRNGVELVALSTRRTLSGITVTGTLPIDLDR